MNRYETIIHIINYGEDSFDAGERAGEIIDISKNVGEILISCEPTRVLDSKNMTDRRYFGFRASQLMETVC